MLREHDLEYRLTATSISTIVCTNTGTVADVCDRVASNCPELKKKIIVNGGGAGLSEEGMAGMLTSDFLARHGIISTQ